MARSPLIPLRPNAFSTSLTQPEQATLTWYVLSGCDRKEAFITFCRPDMLKSKAKAAIDDYVKQFFSRKDCLDYIEAYERTIDSVLHPQRQKKKEDTGVTLEEKKSKALTKLVEYVISEADNIDTADDPKVILDFANKIGLFDMDEEVEEQPRRYLPARCGTCAYRKFCEENTDDMCQYCKYHDFGENNGIHYEKEDMLNISIDSGTEIDKEN